METHSEIVKRLGIRRLAAELGHSNHTTVQGWADRDQIPVKHWIDVLLAAERLDANPPVTADDLMPSALKDAAA